MPAPTWPSWAPTRCTGGCGSRRVRKTYRWRSCTSRPPRTPSPVISRRLGSATTRAPRPSGRWSAWTTSASQPQGSTRSPIADSSSSMAQTPRARTRAWWTSRSTAPTPCRARPRTCRSWPTVRPTAVVCRPSATRPTTAPIPVPACSPSGRWGGSCGPCAVAPPGRRPSSPRR